MMKAGRSAAEAAPAPRIALAPIEEIARVTPPDLTWKLSEGEVTCHEHFSKSFGAHDLEYT